MRWVALGVAGVALAAGVAHADEEVDDGEETLVQEIDRPLILAKGNFELDTAFRTITGTGEERAPFDFVFFDLVVKTTSGASDLSLGVSVILHQPGDTEIEGLEKVWLRLQAKAGKRGAFYLRLMSFNPTDSAIPRRQFADSGIYFKTVAGGKVAIAAGGGLDFEYQFWPDELDMDEQVWTLRFHPFLDATYQIAPKIAAGAGLAFYVPLAHRPEMIIEDPETAVQVTLHGSYALAAAFDAYALLGFNNDADPRVTAAENSTFVIGIRSRM